MGIWGKMRSMKRIFPIIALLVCLSATARAADFTIAPLPSHGLESTPEDFKAAMDDLKAVNAKGIVITKTWGELEPKKGAYQNIIQLAQDFRYHTGEGRDVFFGFQPINTVKRDMPKDLMTVDWDAPEMIARFEALVDAIAGAEPAAPKYISLANEADIYFDSHPKEVAPFIKFFTAASAIMKRKAFPGARIGITVTWEGLVKGRGAMIQKLVDAGDMAIFTYYPMIDLTLQPIENIGEHLDGMLKVAGEKDLYLQEVGYPSGRLIGSTPRAQAFFFKNVIGAIQSRDQIKFASLFVLHDFSPQLCDMLEGYYGFEKAPEEPKKKFRDFLCTLGLKEYGGKEKPAWAEVRRALQ